MFLDYLALVMLIIGISLVIYTFIYIHDIPYQIAKKRDHEQKEAIHLACWLSLFTLHAIWPIVFVWAVMKPKPLAVKIEEDERGLVNQRLLALEAQIADIKTSLSVPQNRTSLTVPQKEIA
jgi:Na+/H+ antiporter NhaD/arsenite permease-like protein